MAGFGPGFGLELLLAVVCELRRTMELLSRLVALEVVFVVSVVVLVAGVGVVVVS